MSAPTLLEPLRDRIGRVLYEEPSRNLNWYDLSEERREPWRKDADRVIEIINQEAKAADDTFIQYAAKLSVEEMKRAARKDAENGAVNLRK